MRTCIFVSLFATACSTAPELTKASPREVELNKKLEESQMKASELQKRLDEVGELNRKLAAGRNDAESRIRSLTDTLQVVGEAWLKTQTKRDKLVLCLPNETEGTGPLPDWLGDADGRCGPEESYQTLEWTVMYTAAGEPQLLLY